MRWRKDCASVGSAIPAPERVPCSVPSARRTVRLAAGAAAVLIATQGGARAVDFGTRCFRLRINKTGHVASLLDVSRRTEYVAKGQAAPLLTLVAGDRELMPTACSFDTRKRLLRLSYGTERVRAKVGVSVHATHVTFRLLGTSGVSPTAVTWGPFPTTIGRTIGETVGVVRDGRFALGLQALNVQTIGGIRREYIEPSGGGRVALATPYGSCLGAHALAREGGVRGSAIALFGCDERDALQTIGAIEVAEGLPHPMLDGVWAKVSPGATAPYLITGFGERDVDAAIALARRLGFRYLYHPGPFESWGHFRLQPALFPDGDRSMRRCVGKAAKAGIRVGLHVLAPFINTNDPYVTPVPDPRLARWPSGATTLAGGVDASATEIAVDDPAPFSQRGNLGAALIGQEIVQYDALRTDPLRGVLTGCKRGAFGTRASAHPIGSPVAKLADHDYGTFYPGIANGMADEMSGRLVKLFRSTGLRQISFDALGGLSTYGYGEYPRNRFVQRCYDGWPKDVINDASSLIHYLWHIHTRMNWGEPWGKAMREGQTDLRFRNQEFFSRNLFPHMLGWFQFVTAGPESEATSLDDMEWMLSKAAGFDAGFAVVADPPSFVRNGQGPAVVQAVRAWESARRAGAFAPEQRERLRSAAGEWHLEAAGDGQWRLWPVSFVRPAAYEAGPASAPADWPVVNEFGAQPIQFVLRVLPDGGAGGTVQDPTLEVDGQRITFRVRLTARQYLVCGAGGKATVCDPDWNVLRDAPVEGTVPQLPAGETTVRFTCRSDGAGRARLQVRFRMVGAPSAVASPAAGPAAAARKPR